MFFDDLGIVCLKICFCWAFIRGGCSSFEILGFKSLYYFFIIIYSSIGQQGNKGYQKRSFVAEEEGNH
jgi:hypothetical protein